MATTFSGGRGEKIRINPLSFTSAEKLETQKDIRNSRAICQRSRVTAAPGAETLSSNPTPMTALIPKDVIQSRGAGSK